ncbi:MAG: 50S ribosomal protein L4 [Gemmatimonadetes bacterium]|uniref:Large ribosomal subunit protein uL4 n=1 Tax=Candidatus Kutchimonas denitrificans TaxID=3056748 RepID=A0AAE4Z5R5_9BACT|nr:50S ribosomal protein L4 [Gemmatimonadota bacterium]NIR73849.1 50S ribosomal protein L4 [Candidatus Kutchimonas denitrificans]NIR99655.1 50S ribosomal protein L4 [Gemmatimonadota bacterium]NIT65240.1 50S ribosomal protein L4 [Gemmatimonadota bacterium]NIW73689.1 50S ribosomal protein L4 [Gemmatimonadota bacterium]
MAAEITARYYKADGAAGDTTPLPAELFDGVVNEQAIQAAVKAYLANQRRGTAKAKSRPEVRGGGRKPWRQKGTGRARVGSIRSPIWRGGGVIFPPRPRSYRQDLSKKVRRLARHSALNARAADDRVIVVENLELEEPKTRKLVKLFEKIGVADEKILILTGDLRRNLYLSARNIPRVRVLRYGDESAYDVIWADTVIIEESALSTGGAAKEASDA